MEDHSESENRPSRRATNRIDESTETSLSDAMDRAMKPHNKLELEAMEILRLGLTSNSFMSTTSGSTERMNRAHGTISKPLEVIGRGTCGTVYEIPGIDRVLKLGSPSRNNIWWDFLATNTAHNVFATCEPLFKHSRYFQGDISIPRVPRGFEFHTAQDTVFWNDFTKKLPADEEMPRTGFIMERIRPLPEEIRRALITLFFHPSEQAVALASVNKENSACLIRPYLGKNAQPDVEYDSLWNFELHLNQMTQLGLDTRRLVKEMAIGLSVVHWQACLDGRDIEFVLGTSDERPAFPPTIFDVEDVSKPFDISDIGSKQRSTRMWVLDFDKTRRFSMEDTNAEILGKLIPAVHGNDPYYPNPTLDENLWNAFANIYIKASLLILASKMYSLSWGSNMRLLQLPTKFIKILREKFIEQAEFEASIENYIQFDSGCDDEDEEKDEEEEEEEKDQGEDDGGVKVCI